MIRDNVHLIETVRMRDGTAPLWYLHLRRLAASCLALGIPLPRDLPTPEGGEDRIHRLEVGPRGVAVSERPVGSTSPIRLIVSNVPHQPYPHKTTDRSQFDRALTAAAAAGADDAVMLSPGVGYVAEAAVWGLFWWDGDHVCTPPLDLGILPGVARGRLAELVGTLHERRVTIDELAGRSVFVANAARGIVPVASLAGRPVPPNRATATLAATFWS